MGVRFMVMSMLLRLMVIDNDDEVGSFIGSDDKVEWFNSNCFDEQLTDIHWQVNRQTKIWNCRVAFTTEVPSYGFWSLLLLHQIPKKDIIRIFLCKFFFSSSFKVHTTIVICVCLNIKVSDIRIIYILCICTPVYFRIYKCATIFTYKNVKIHLNSSKLIFAKLPWSQLLLLQAKCQRPGLFVSILYFMRGLELTQFCIKLKY